MYTRVWFSGVSYRYILLLSILLNLLSYFVNIMRAYLLIIIHLKRLIYQYRFHIMDSLLYIINYLDKLLEYVYFIIIND